MAEVRFYFDLSCPWTYLAALRLRETATRTGAAIAWKPFLLAAVDPQAAAQRWPAEARRAAQRRADLAAWADYCDVAISLPPRWPADVSLASRGAVFARGGGSADFVLSLYAAEFGHGRDLADVGLLCELAARAGLDEAAFRAALDDPAMQRVVDANGAELLARGGYASATMIIGDAMFVGNESMPLVEFALGRQSGMRFVMPGQHG